MTTRVVLVGRNGVARAWSRLTFDACRALSEARRAGLDGDLRGHVQLALADEAWASIPELASAAATFLHLLLREVEVERDKRAAALAEP